MAKISLDLSGRRGLVERYQGDIEQASSDPHLRYLGAEGQFADGFFNPMKRYGFLSPPNDTFSTITGTIAAEIISMVNYKDEVYVAEEGENILQLTLLNDTSLSNYSSVSSGSTIKDMTVYEANGDAALVYAIDDGTSNGLTIGYTTLEGTNGLEIYNTTLPSSSAADGDLQYSTASVDEADPGDGLAQSFDSDDLNALEVDGATVWLKRTGGTGSGITLRLSLRARADASDAPYSDQGAWATSTSYSVNDVVTNGGDEWVCIEAHTSGSISEPGVGGDETLYWRLFNSPSTADLAYGDIDASTILTDTNITNYNGHQEIKVKFNTQVTLTASTQYWLVLEEEGANMGASDTYTWVCTNNSGTVITDQSFCKHIDGLNTWITVGNNNDVTQQRTAQMTLTLAESEVWSSDLANGKFSQDTGETNFLFRADNGLLYWVVGRNIHTLDGSPTGGPTGRINENVLSFPPYINVVDIAESRSRMYIGIQTSEASELGNIDWKTAKNIGVYVWDRRSQLTGNSDFYPCPGAAEIRSLFTDHNGGVVAITLNNSGFTEIRVPSGSKFEVIHTLGDLAFPAARRSSTQVGDLTIWLGSDGVFYGYGPVAPGERPGVFKLGDISGEASGQIYPGPILSGHRSSPTPRLGVFTAWRDTTPTYNLQKWYPNGEGTIDSISQTPGQGNAYSIVRPLPPLSNINHITVHGIPTSTSSSDTAATLKIYFNMSSTPWASKTITKKEMNKGYVEIPVHKPNINSVQFEIEWPTAEELGADTFHPAYAVIDYTSVNTFGGKTA